ncbi:ribonucleoprotein p18 mitochondrial precursor [Perkinsela sp. CCAP 1560/4]|nr:ribonucleoprotein p18 mitochondrial precursor [Perkinsela sp. CCAP 1560/4]|eukprot:KNH07463.1 ribonucleoprotein p18 mitochondrial precursor [Perkinsela sp. CCAP 1560/4]
MYRVGHTVTRQLRAASSQMICTRRSSYAKEAKEVQTDLFGYEVNTDTSPWIKKIDNVKYYDQAGELLVEMNLNNTPPDLSAYNATLRRIHECSEKFKSPEEHAPKERGDKLCAMLDLIEEMEQRSKITPNKESWVWVMKECVSSGNYRMGYIVERVWKNKFGDFTQDAEDKNMTQLLEENTTNAVRSKESGKEHPPHLKKVTPLFQTVE